MNGAADRSLNGPAVFDRATGTKRVPGVLAATEFVVRRGAEREVVSRRYWTDRGWAPEPWGERP